MPPTAEASKAGYFNLWNRAKLRPEHASAVKAVAQKIIANKGKYVAVEAKTGVPWFMIGPIHNRESSLRFNAHLHCGDPLTARTTHVPRGRPAKGNPPFTWEESALDALTMPPHSLEKVKSWTVERILFETERYNGWGYLGKGNSPYLWAATSAYGDRPGETGGDGVHDGGGKYVADHVFDRNAIDKQLGCVALLKTLAELDPSVAARLNDRQPTIPKADVDKAISDATDKEKKAGAGGAASTAAGGASEGTKAGTTQPDKPGTGFMPSFLAWSFIGVGVAVLIVVAIQIARKNSYIKRMTGQA